MLKKHIGKLFIIASKLCSRKQIPKSASNVFKLIYSQIENFHKKATLLSNFNKFWALQNSDPVIQSLNKIHRTHATTITTYDFSTLYTK